MRDCHIDCFFLIDDFFRKQKKIRNYMKKSIKLLKKKIFLIYCNLITILKKKLYSDGIEMPEEVIEYLAYSITSNVRELEGALISLLAQSSLNKREINMSLAKEMIDRFVKNTTREVSIDYIQKVVCDYFELSLELLNSKTRKRRMKQYYEK